MTCILTKLPKLTLGVLAVAKPYMRSLIAAVNQDGPCRKFPRRIQSNACVMEIITLSRPLLSSSSLSVSKRGVQETCYL